MWEWANEIAVAYPRAVHRVRLLLIAVFALGAVLSGLGHTENARWMVAFGYLCFAVGAGIVLWWRRNGAGKVFNREEKTGE